MRHKEKEQRRGDGEKGRKREGKKVLMDHKLFII